MGWRDDILRQSANLQKRKERKRQRKSRWHERIATRLLGLGKSKGEVRDLLAGIGKHQRQRVRPRGYWPRKRKLQRERDAHRRRVAMRAKSDAKLVRNRKRKKAERR